jgi:hypothetical protein
MSRYRLEITLGEDLLARLDERRGHEPRASFVRRALVDRVASPLTREPEVVVKNLRETEDGHLTVDKPGKPSEFSVRMRSPDVGEGTPLPKIAPRRAPR